MVEKQLSQQDMALGSANRLKALCETTLYDRDRLARQVAEQQAEINDLREKLARAEKKKGEFDAIYLWARKQRRIKSIIDIGANVGEFGNFLYEFFKAETLVQFEPLVALEPRIRAATAKVKDHRLFQCALSDETGEATFHQVDALESSSLLKLGETHKSNFKQQIVASITVPLRRLDDVLANQRLEPGYVIKMDVQGVEDRIIKGGRQTFRRGDFVIVEMSYCMLYENQSLFNEVHALLAEVGYRFKGIINQVLADNHEPLFSHCFYMNENPER